MRLDRTVHNVTLLSSAKNNSAMWNLKVLHATKISIRWYQISLNGFMKIFFSYRKPKLVYLLLNTIIFSFSKSKNKYQSCGRMHKWTWFSLGKELQTLQLLKGWGSLRPQTKSGVRKKIIDLSYFMLFTVNSCSFVRYLYC